MKLTLGKLLILTAIVFTIILDFLYIVKYGNPFEHIQTGLYAGFVTVTSLIIVFMSGAYLIHLVFKNWNTRL